MCAAFPSCAVLLVLQIGCLDVDEDDGELTNVELLVLCPHRRGGGRRVFHLRSGVCRPRRRPFRHPEPLLRPELCRMFPVPCRRGDCMRRRGSRRRVGLRDAVDHRLPVPPGSCALVNQAGSAGLPRGLARAVGITSVMVRSLVRSSNIVESCLLTDFFRSSSVACNNSCSITKDQW